LTLSNNTVIAKKKNSLELELNVSMLQR